MNQLQPSRGLATTPWRRVAATRELTHNRLFPGRRCCCDVAHLCQGILAAHQTLGRLWISLGAILLSDISSQMTESNHELNSNSVTDSLTHKCYRCPDCATPPPDAERQRPLPISQKMLYKKGFTGFVRLGIGNDPRVGAHPWIQFIRHQGCF
jgi:hypothetical protein